MKKFFYAPSDTIVEKYLFILTTVALFFFNAYTLFMSVSSHLEFISFPYQHEYMEGAALNTTKVYLNNENPFDIRHQPQDTYVYGFLYPLVVSPFAEVYGNTLAVHRCVTYIFIFLTCLLIFLALNSIKLNPVFSFTAAVVIHQSFIYNGLIPIARPEGLGIFLFTLGILIPWRFKFSSWSCLVSIFLGVLAFLTKPYYILVIPFVCIYIFTFVSKRKALWYAAISVLLILIMIVSVSLIYETLLNNSFFHPKNIAIYDFSHMKDQLIRYLKVNIYLLLIIILSFTIKIKKFSYDISKNATRKFFDSVSSKFLFNKNINVFRNEPLIKTNYDLLFGFVFLFSLVLFIVKLGGHTGNGRGAYLYHLASPFLVLTTFQLVRTTNDKLFKSVVAILLIYTLTRQFKPARFDYATPIACFENIRELIRKSNNPLNSPETVSIMIEQNKVVLNSGHSEYFRTGVSDLSLLTSTSRNVEKREMEFEKELNDQIINKKFDVILLTKGNHYRLIDTAALIQNYLCADTICAYMPLKEWKIELWYPKK